MNKMKLFLNELLLYSGQYALFYIIMHLSEEKMLYFKDFGHNSLLVLLIIQTIFLVNFGSKVVYRFLGSLIAPFFYTIIEYNVDYDFVFNIAHIFFWIFSIAVGVIQAIQLVLKDLKLKKINEYLITFINIMTFLFIYFYLDLNIDLKVMLKNNKISKEEYNSMLDIFHLKSSMAEFFYDTAHIYIVMGGLLLAASIAVGRIKILELNEEIKNIFGRYVDSNIRDKIMVEGHGRSEKKDLCILFSDIRNFTPIAENNSPEEVTRMLNVYFTKWYELAKKYSGTIDKYIGDAIMIAFDKGNSSDNAVKCAIEMLGELENLKKKLSEKGLPVFEDIGIGIDYGTVIAGDIGSINRVNYTYIGDTVNIASRLESLCKTLHKNLIVSHAVYERVTVKEGFKENKQEIFLKGKNKGIKVFYLN